VLQIEKLHVNVEGKEIVKGLSLGVKEGETAAIMGPNGSGKSTLSQAIMGHPGYEITKGRVILDGKDITEMEPNERSIAGLFLSFQYPLDIPGVSVNNFLRTALNARRKSPIPLPEFKKLIKKQIISLKIDPLFLQRYVNDGFSGGEKKRMEILQLLTLDPTTAILDETDSGLDIDALKIVAKGINTFKTEKKSVLLITHYQRILSYIIPDTIHVMVDGRIVKSGGKELAEHLEEHGYEWAR